MLGGTAKPLSATPMNQENELQMSKESSTALGPLSAHMSMSSSDVGRLTLPWNHWTFT